MIEFNTDHQFVFVSIDQRSLKGKLEENGMSWLPIAEYSLKHRVSISTLRRKIKAQDVSFKFEDGKYLILDAPVDSHLRGHRPSQISEKSPGGMIIGSKIKADFIEESALPLLHEEETVTKEQTTNTKSESKRLTLVDDSELSAFEISTAKNKEKLNLKKEDTKVLYGPDVVQSLLTEVKKAYSLILAEKEEQILQLKEEVSDLKTLVRILEGEMETQTQAKSVEL